MSIDTIVMMYFLTYTLIAVLFGIAVFTGIQTMILLEGKHLKLTLAYVLFMCFMMGFFGAKADYVRMHPNKFAKSLEKELINDER